MKRCVVQGTLAMVLCGLAIANDNYAQLLDKKITLDLSNVSLEVVLKAIGDQAGVRFFYSRDHVNLKQEVSIVAVDKTLQQVFEEIFPPLKLKYHVHEKHATVTLKLEEAGEQKETAPPAQRSFNAPPPETAAAITGTVTDAQTQQPMAGVNVVVKGTLKGTSTDADGQYVIEADERDVLVFSFIGFKSVEMPVGNQTIIDLALEEDIVSLGQVTVSTGYWEMDKKESTGNIVKITADEIAKQPVSNPILALQGRVAGLNVQQVSGVPGGSFSNLQIRGQNSVRFDGNDPLFVIDGVPYPSQNLSELAGSGIFPNPLNILNPSDVESIEVLKDADATAIYGSLGANGVLLITTKKAKGKGATVDFNLYSGVGKVTNRVDLLSTAQYLEMRNEAFQNDKLVPNTTNAPDLLVWDQNRYTNWQDELFGGSSSITNAYLSFSGGNETARFMASGGYLRETTVFPGDFPYQKGSLNLGSNLSSNDRKFTMSFSTNLAVEHSTLPISDMTKTAVSLAPNSPEPYDENGKLNWEGGTWANPYAALLKEYDGKTNSLITNLTLDCEFTPGLKIQVRGGINLIQNDVTRTTPLASYSPLAEPLGEVELSDNVVRTWIVEPQLTYAKEIFKNTRLDAIIGTTFRETISTGTLVKATGFASDGQINNALAASNVDLLADTYSEYRYHAVFGRVGFNWKERYLLNLTGRRDGSSRFGSENRFANFWAIGAAWIFSKEDFLPKSILSFGKVKASFGTSGNDQIGDYSYLSTYVTFVTPYQDTKPIVISRLGNDGYQWELVKKLEVGLELGFLEDRIRLNTYYYSNKSSNQLVEYSLPKTTGFSSITANLDAAIENMGLEFELNTTNISTKDFKWTSSFNFTLPKNRLVKFPNLEGSSYANTYRVDEPLYIRMVYGYAGIGNTGLYQFDDYNEDGFISNPNDAQYIIDTSRDYYGGFQNAFSYKGFTLDFLFQIVGQDKLDYKQAFVVPGRLGNQPPIVMDRWRGAGENTDIQKFSTTSVASSAYTRYSLSDAALVDASFIRLKNISLSYSFPSAITERMRFQNLRVYAQGQNLFTLTDYDFLDPETGVNLPPVTMITMGVQLTF